MQKNHLTKLPVYARTIDNIVGVVYLRQLLLNDNVTIDKLVEQVHFVPEQKTVESLLEFFRRFRGWEKLAYHYLWEDIFWRRKHEHIDWLEKEIRR